MNNIEYDFTLANETIKMSLNAGFPLIFMSHAAVGPVELDADRVRLIARALLELADMADDSLGMTPDRMLASHGSEPAALSHSSRLVAKNWTDRYPELKLPLYGAAKYLDERPE
jgi:hypothetical protein